MQNAAITLWLPHTCVHAYTRVRIHAQRIEAVTKQTRRYKTNINKQLQNKQWKTTTQTKGLTTNSDKATKRTRVTHGLTTVRASTSHTSLGKAPGL